MHPDAESGADRAAVRERVRNSFPSLTLTGSVADDVTSVVPPFSSLITVIFHSRSGSEMMIMGRAVDRFTINSEGSEELARHGRQKLTPLLERLFALLRSPGRPS